MYSIILTTAFGTTFKAPGTVRGLSRAITTAARYLAAGFVSYRVRRVA